MFGSILILLALIFLVCAGLSKFRKKEVASIKPEESGKLMVMAAVVLGVGLWLSSDDGPSHGDAVTEVLMTIPDSDNSVHNFGTGDLESGIAVVINETAGYWVKDGKVYAVNGVARNMSPSIGYAPTEINRTKVQSQTN